MRRVKPVVVAGVMVLMLAVAGPSAGPAAPRQSLDLAGLLSTYAAGRHDEALKSVADAGDEAARALRLEWPTTARRWIDETPESRHRRMLAAASLALETEYLRAERGDWTLHTTVCLSYRELAVPIQQTAGNCVLQWAYAIVMERVTPDESERAWLLAASALAGGVRDQRLLHVPPYPPTSRTQTRGLIDRALERFPDDAELRLEQAIASAMRLYYTVDGGRAMSQALMLPTRTAEAPALEMFGALVNDPSVGAEARLRLGLLQWVLNRDDEASLSLREAATRAGDPELKYLAQFLIGWTALQRSDLAAARMSLSAALETRPNSQSAAVALAAIDLKEGDAGRGYERARSALDDPSKADDPWRLFLYGHHAQWPARIAELRRRLQ